jgi:hypothetical protein
MFFMIMNVFLRGTCSRGAPFDIDVAPQRPRARDPCAPDSHSRACSALTGYNQRLTPASLSGGSGHQPGPTRTACGVTPLIAACHFVCQLLEIGGLFGQFSVSMSER